MTAPTGIEAALQRSIGRGIPRAEPRTLVGEGARI